MQEEIRFYRATGKYGFLSNLHRVPVYFEGRLFDCAERAYQFGKPKCTEVAEWLVAAPKPHLCAAVAHSLFVYDVRADWNEIKVERMQAVLKAKFTQNYPLKEALLATGDVALIEESNTDAFWGIGKKKNGKNMLGVLLMQLRDSLRGNER
jgi:ribA/ribD-fused uncharacterized protein